jgi:hypothetical protein
METLTYGQGMILLVDDEAALALALRSEAREDAQPKHDCGVQVPEPCTGGIERPRECLINDLQVESRAKPGGDRGIVIHLNYVLVAETQPELLA